jgi:hypothetical protein
VHQIVELSAWQGCAAAHDAHLLGDVERIDHHRDGVRVLEIEDGWRSVGQGVRIGLSCGNAAVAIGPLDGTR